METEEDLHLTEMPRGYRKLGERQLKKEELIPNGWTPELPPNLDMQRYQHTVGHFANKRPFATWMVFERLPEFNESHGPKRFSLLFLCADGVAAYQALYWTNQMKPRAIAIIQPGTGFGGNWTDFFKQSDPFYWTVSHNPAGMPDYVYCGYWSHNTATSASATPDHILFDWPEYTYSQPAVGYPQSEVFLYKKETREHAFHIIRNGVKEKVTASQLNALEEETRLSSEQYHPNSKTTLQDALAKGHMLLEDFDRQLRNGSN